MKYCKFCGATNNSDFPPVNIMYDVREETLHYLVCNKCLGNIEQAMRIMHPVFTGKSTTPEYLIKEAIHKLSNGWVLVADDIPF